MNDNHSQIISAEPTSDYELFSSAGSSRPSGWIFFDRQHDPPHVLRSFISSATSSSALPQHLWVQARSRKYKCICDNMFFLFFLLCCHIAAEPVEGKLSLAPCQGKSLSAGLPTSTTDSVNTVPTRCSNKLQPSHSASGKLINGNPHLVAKDHLNKNVQRIHPRCPRVYFLFPLHFPCRCPLSLPPSWGQTEISNQS